MNIGTFCDIILKELGYATTEKKLTRRAIIVQADAIRTEQIGLLFTGGVIATQTSRIGITKSAEINDAYYISKTAPVVFDPIRARFYATMPTDRLSFTSNSGIRMIRGAQDNTGGYFIEQKGGSGAAYGLLESAQLAGNVGFEMEGNTIWFNNMLPDTYQNVLITYLPTLIGMNETDILPVEYPEQLIRDTFRAFVPQKEMPSNFTTDNVSE